MSFIASRSRKALIALAAVATLAGTVSITTTEANAWGGGGWGHGWGHGYGYGALAGGLALGAIATGAAYNDCYIGRQRFVDAWGYEHFRRVRFCD